MRHPGGDPRGGQAGPCTDDIKIQDTITLAKMGLSDMRNLFVVLLGDDDYILFCD
jgi:hypothetical protein